MANSLLNKLSAFLGRGGVSVVVADVAMSSGGLTMTYGAQSGAAAYFDFGINQFTRGKFKIRMKSYSMTTSALLGLVVSTTTTFATRQLVATVACISAAAGLSSPNVASYQGDFDNDPTTFRYARWENLGTALGATPITFDTEILALW